MAPEYTANVFHMFGPEGGLSLSATLYTTQHSFERHNRERINRGSGCVAVSPEYLHPARIKASVIQKRQSCQQLGWLPTSVSQSETVAPHSEMPEPTRIVPEKVNGVNGISAVCNRFSTSFTRLFIISPLFEQACCTTAGKRYHCIAEAGKRYHLYCGECHPGAEYDCIAMHSFAFVG